MALSWHFVLPDDHHLPSGGNRYNEQLIRALRRASQPVEVIGFDTYQEALSTDQSGSFFVDSLFVRHLAAVARPRARAMHTIFVLHHLESMDPPPGKTRKQCWAEEQAAFAHVDTFLVTSSFSEHYLREHRIYQPVIVVEPGIEIATPQKPVSDTVQALMVANLVTRKGIFPWLQQLATLLQVTDTFTLTIVGRTDLEPAYAEACQQLVNTHPVLREKAHFTGALSYDQVQEYYASAQVFVSAARIETFGMALQEAKAYRVPLLTLAGGYAEQHVASDCDGYVFRNLHEMADFFVDLVRSPPKLAALQDKVASRLPTARYGWDEAARSLIQQLMPG